MPQSRMIHIYLPLFRLWPNSLRRKAVWRKCVKEVLSHSLISQGQSCYPQCDHLFLSKLRFRP